MTTLTIACALIGAISLFNLALAFALIGRVRTLQELVEARQDPDLPRAGDPIGRFEVTTTRGQLLSDESLAGSSTLVGFFTPHCEPCERVQAELEARPPSLPMVAFIDGTEAEPDAAAVSERLSSIGRVAYAGASDAVKRAFRTKGYPTLLRIENGLVAAAGYRLQDVLP